MTSGEFNSVDCATLQIQGTFISMLYNFLSSLPGLISETLLPKMNIYKYVICLDRYCSFYILSPIDFGKKVLVTCMEKITSCGYFA